MRRITWLVVIGILALASSAMGQTIFAGWIRKAEGPVVVKAGSKSTNLDSGHAGGRRLYAGQQIRASKGSATLLVYGHQFELTAARGWYSVPDDSKKAPAGKDVYAKYISRAGRTRDARFSERLWQAIAVLDLANPAPPPGYAVRIRLAPAKSTFKVGEHVAIEIANDSSTPLYVSVLDVDCEGGISRIIPRSDDQHPVSAHSGWTRMGNAFTLTLPAGWKEGTERLKVIATTMPVDFAPFDSDNRSRYDDPGTRPSTRWRICCERSQAGVPQNQAFGQLPTQRSRFAANLIFGLARVKGIDLGYIKGIRKLAIFLFLCAIGNLGLWLTDRSTEGDLEARGIRVSGVVSKRILEQVQHSDNVPSQYFHLWVHYPVRNATLKKRFDVSYELYRDSKEGSSIGVVYDPKDPSTVILSDHLKSRSGSTGELYVALGLLAAGCWLLYHAAGEAVEDRNKRANG